MPELVLALDPSTDITGAAIFRLEASGASLVAYTAFDAFELTGQPKSRHELVDRMERIAATRQALSAWLATQPEVECVAYETRAGGVMPPARRSSWPWGPTSP